MRDVYDHVDVRASLQLHIYASGFVFHILLLITQKEKYTFLDLSERVAFMYISVYERLCVSE
jgi:hypothetical protein